MILFLIFFCPFRGEKKQLQKKIGQRIIALREEKGWTQADLARACNKDRQAIEIIENGKVNPTIFSLYEIARALEVELSILVEL
ncbi:helix-turn-helix transcriptional regulator [Sediminibacterium sp.]|uniref:helix-turn-helix domain-containing protein n=1 Tax=Sediminibacterium sp. TaxID=1917865 RepID=UPI003447AAAA|nr:helix-turn-helix transcriptional regulator [Sediminibacterium sp.]